MCENWMTKVQRHFNFHSVYSGLKVKRHVSDLLETLTGQKVMFQNPEYQFRNFRNAFELFQLDTLWYVYLSH